jgi:hypothetical protein
MGKKVLFHLASINKKIFGILFERENNTFKVFLGICGEFVPSQDTEA